ncbi:hypothetical protein [Nereida sp. MMG025]|uniref:hypothetical protein n=1 Tax=Nereida sp. MMG025 TaxID=2909981 RepID=UPI001F1839B1|nr:hypothetical protein [Nereida sp. MMG025]MCF6443203.1 hypothetical protein [Nereida sp. MMG025]
MIGRLFKYIGYLAVLALLALVAFAYVGPLVMEDAFKPSQVDVSKPVQLQVQ